MIIGIDVGGTNTDAAIVGEGIHTIKLPNELGIGGVLKEVSKHADLKHEKVVVSTSVPLNLIISKFNEYRTLTLLIPGPGLNYSNYGVVVKGYVNHRGDVVEDLDEDEILQVLNESSFENVAIASKFSVRNAALEDIAKKIVSKKIGEECIALSHYAGGMNYPHRINTTVVNAKIKKTVKELTDLIKTYTGEFYYFKGDGGIVPHRIVLENPSELYNSSPAAVALGAYYLTGEEEAIVVDIGGTSTDFVPIEGGMPKIIDGVDIAGRKTLIRCVDSFSIPFGGDSAVRDGKLKPERAGKPIAFGGDSFTLTDALNCLGYEIGDKKASIEAGREMFSDLKDAESVVEQFMSVVAETLKQTGYERVIGAGYLASILIPEITRKAGVNYVVPEHSEAANAVGVAVSKLSLNLYARFDTETGKAIYNGVVEKSPFGVGSLPSDDELIDLAVKKVKETARNFGALEEDIGEVRVIYFNSFTVVRGGIKRGVIADVIVQIEPGVRYDRQF
jgi:N-methylhydantoinase A/oxoprolinase/acetone carboxylase beta subunit